MKLKNTLTMGLIALSSFGAAKAQKIATHFIPEVGAFGTVKAAPTFVGGVNCAVEKGKNYADVFIGGTLNCKAEPGFIGIFFDNYTWNKNFSSWFRDLFMASKSGVTSTLEVAPVKFNAAAGKFNFGVMPAYGRYDDFVNHKTTHGIKLISQTMYTINPKNKLCLEMQYASIPTKNILKTHFGKFKDCFNFTATYARTIGKKPTKAIIIK